MAQTSYSAIAANQSGTAYRTQDNDRYAAALSQHSGSGRPSYAVKGTVWLDASVTPHVIWEYDGAQDTAVALLDPIAHEYIPLNGDKALWGGTSTGAANAYVLTVPKAPAAYYAGMTVRWLSHQANTGAVTINVNSLGVKNGTKRGATALVANDILNAAIVTATYDGTQFQVSVSASSGDLLSTNNLSDLANAATARTNLGLGTAATAALDTDTALAADSDTRVPSQKAVKTYVDAIAAAGSTDTTARDWIAATSLRVLLNSSVASGALVNAYQWELGSDEWATGSSGYTFTAGSPGYYVNTPGSYSANQCTGGTASASTEDGSTYAASKAFDGNTGTQWETTNGNYAPSWLQYTFASAKNIRRYRIYGYSTSSQNIKNWTFEVYSGGTWNVIDTQTNQTITTAWAQYDVAAHGYSSTQYRINISANNGSANYSVIGEVEMMELSAPSDMTLLTPAVTTSTAATAADLYFLYKDDSGSAVAGTDLTVELSANGGTNYTAVTPTLQAAFDGTYSIYKAAASGMTSGTSLKARIKTLNGKSQRIGPAFIGKR